MGGAFTHNQEIDFDQLRRNIEEWKSINHLLTRDLYVLTKWHHPLDNYGWTALAYDAPDIGESLLLAFRQEKSETEEFTARLPFAEDSVQYELNNADTGEKTVMDGKELRENGLKIKLDHPRASAMFRIYAKR